MAEQWTDPKYAALVESYRRHAATAGQPALAVRAFLVTQEERAEQEPDDPQ